MFNDSAGLLHLILWGTLNRELKLNIYRDAGTKASGQTFDSGFPSSFSIFHSISFSSQESPLRFPFRLVHFW